jgi:hypothetical protein
MEIEHVYNNMHGKPSFFKDEGLLLGAGLLLRGGFQNEPSFPGGGFQNELRFAPMGGF